MRIPAEVIPLVGHLGKDVALERKAEPVSAYGGMPTGLRPAPREEPPTSDDKRRRQPPGASTPGSPPPGGERRQSERRIQQQPVFLDTRSKQSRRRGPGATGIDVKV